MQSGVSPLILQKNQFAIGINCSIRGGFIHTRPPYQKKNLVFSNPLVQAIVEGGNFQGAGYYRPDYGTESLIAQISGHLLKFTETGSAWTVSDISVPNSLNSTTAPQVWMWQSEKWMIVNDGSGVLPIFYDGTVSRRSYGPSVLLGTTSIAITPPNPRVIGEVIQATLTAPYTGPYGVPVLFNGEFYQPTQSVSGYLVSLTNVTDTPGHSIPSGSPIVVSPVQTGTITSIGGVSQNPATGLITSVVIHVSAGSVLSIGSFLTISGKSWTVQSGSGLIWSIVPNFPAQYPTDIPALGAAIFVSSSSQPSFILANTSQAFIVPSVGSSIQVTVTAPYTGVSGQAVTINGKQYTIASLSTSPTGNILYLINLTDTSALTIASGSKIMSVPELPAGRMGAYGNGRNWFSLTDGISYQAADIVGGPSGTPANNYRDSVLKMTENDFLAGGGSFRLPGTGDIITAMTFPAAMDTSLGQGPLEIFTAFTGFSNNSPADRASWSVLTFPIQTENLKGRGALGQNSTIDVNSDTFFRSSIGIGSLILARRDFVNNSWGNKPISNEMQRIFSGDDQNLLSHGSSADFDNRFLTTCSPHQVAQGVVHIGLGSMNMDLLSSLRGDVPPSWEGAWTGLNVLQTVTGRVNGSIRTLAFTLNINTRTIELYESLQESTTHYLDNDVTPILSVFETPVAFNKDVKGLTQLVKLASGKLYLSELKGNVHVKVLFRPDFYPCWTTWREFDLCSTVGTGNRKSGYKMPIQLGEPSIKECQTENNRPLNYGYFFQFRFEITGAFKFNGFFPKAVAIPTPDESVVGCSETECQEIACDLPDDLRLYSLQGLPT